MSEIRFSRGADIHDNRPQQRRASDFGAFVVALDADRAPSKAGAAYVSASFNGDGRRCAEGVQPTRFLALDLDRIAADVLPELRLHLARFSGVAWPTHSSKPDAPRERCILELDRDATRAECIAIGEALARDLAEEFGDAVMLDPATFRPEQPLFVPPTGAALARFEGEPLAVDAYLARHTSADAPERPQSDASAAHDLDHIERGETLHDAILRVVARLAAAGVDAATIRSAAIGLLERAYRKRGARVDEIARDELGRMIDGALAKFRATQPGDLPRALNLPQLANTEPASPAFVVQDWLPAGEVTLFAGHGGSGKSANGMHLAVCIAAGRPWHGIPVARRRVLFVSLEDPATVLHWRLSRICAWLGINLADLHGRLQVFDAAHADAALIVEGRDGAALTHVYEWLRERMTGAQVLVLDGASDAYAANENVRRDVRLFVRALRRLTPADGACLLLAHVDKLTARNPDTSQGFSGSTAWSNSVRARWYLRPADDDDALLLEVQKSNHAPVGASMRLRWNQEAHVFCGELSMPTSRLERELVAADERDALLQLIRDADSRGEPVPAATTGARTTYSTMKAMPGFPPAFLRSKGRFWSELEGLRQAGRVTVGGHKTPDRKVRSVLKAAP